MRNRSQNLQSQLHRRGFKVLSRSIRQRTGREGSSHDPYSYTEVTMKTNAKRVTVHLGLGDWIKVNGKKIHLKQQEDIYRKFQCHTGLSLHQAKKIYDRLNPWFDDLIGDPYSYK